MSPCHPFRPVPGQCGPNRRGPLPAPPFDPRDYWATRKCVSRLSASLETKLDKADVVDPGAATEAGKAADAKSTYEELNGVLAKLAKKADRTTTLAGYGITDAATKTEIAAKADLVDGKVPAAQLPSYVDDVLEYDTMSAFPATGESSKIYVAKDTNLVYRWSGTQYVEISPSPVLDDTVTEESQNGVKSSGIWSWVKSLLPNWLTSDYAEPATVESVATKADKTALDDKRDKDDLAVYKLVKSSFVLHKDGLTDITLPFIGKAQDKPYPYSEYDWVFEFEGAAAFSAIVFSDGQWKLNVEDGAEYGYSSASEDALRIEFDNGYVATRSSIISVVPVDDQQLAAVATDNTLKPSDGDLVKYDSANDRFVKAIAGVDYRDPQDNTCHKTEYGNKWIASNPPEGLGNTQPYYDEAALYWVWWSEDHVIPYTADGAPDAKSLTFSYNGTTFTATRSAVCTNGKRFVTEDVAAKQSDIFGNDGKPSDMFTTDLLGKKVANIKANSSAFAPEYDATSKYAVDEFVWHDGNIYQCKTAIAEGGEAWNAEHWELRKLHDFFTESNSLLTGTIDAEVISKGTAPDAHLEAPTDEHLKLILADNSVAYDSAKALPYKLASVIGDRVVATMTLTAASTDITLPTIAANDTTVKDFILDVTNAYAVEGVATDAGINIPRTDFKLVTRDGESLTDVTTVKAGKSAFICFTQKSPVVVDGTTYPCWCVIQLPFGDPS